MSKRIEAYLRKRSVHEVYPVQGEIGAIAIDRVIVIPALAERETLPKALESLEACDSALLDTTLVLVVVNNRGPEHVSDEAIAENSETLDWLSTVPYPALHLAWIDASSPGHELARKDGVGMARKIGMDWATAMLHDHQARRPLIICLDADTLVEPNYLDALDSYGRRDNAWAGVIRYAHPLEGTPEEQSAIVCYELFLRYMELGLQYAGSPYAFHTIGSTIVCTPEAYAAVSGMNRRMAGEDFYFLQQLGKTGGVHRINDTTVTPSPRPSWRVPFGTGRRVGRYLNEEQDEWRVYHPESYRILRDWLQGVERSLESDGAALLQLASAIDSELAVFLEQLEFALHWDKLRDQSSSSQQLLKKFHTFFDGFQTLKLIHHLRDHGYPDQNTFAALSQLGALGGHDVEVGYTTTPTASEQIALLTRLRG